MSTLDPADSSHNASIDAQKQQQQQQQQQQQPIDTPVLVASAVPVHLTAATRSDSPDMSSSSDVSNSDSSSDGDSDEYSDDDGYVPAHEPRLRAPAPASILKVTTQPAPPPIRPGYVFAPEPHITQYPKRVASHSRRVVFTLPADHEDKTTARKPPPRNRRVGPPARKWFAAGELLQVYMAACTRLNTKPLNVLVWQLQQASALDLPVMELNFTGLTKIPTSNWGAIGELLFRAGDIKSISFEGVNLRDEIMQPLVKSLLLKRSLESLNLSHNPIKLPGFDAVGFLLRRGAQLKHLNLSAISIDAKCANSLGVSLLTCIGLESLVLQNCGLKNSVSLEAICEGVRRNHTVRLLDLQSNGIGPKGAKVVAHMVQKNDTLLCLRLGGNPIQDHGAEFIADSLSVNRTLQKMELWGCSIQLPGLTALAQVLTKNSPLEAINLGYNALGNADGMETLCKALISNKYLRELILASTGMQSESAVALAGALAENKHLAVLDIRHNDLGQGGLIALSVAMRLNRSVIQLFFDMAKPIVGNPPHSAIPDPSASDVEHMVNQIQQFCSRNATEMVERPPVIYNKPTAYDNSAATMAPSLTSAPSVLQSVSNQISKNDSATLSVGKPTGRPVSPIPPASANQHPSPGKPHELPAGRLQSGQSLHRPGEPVGKQEIVTIKAKILTLGESLAQTLAHLSTSTSAASSASAAGNNQSTPHQPRALHAGSGPTAANGTLQVHSPSKGGLKSVSPPPSAHQQHPQQHLPRTPSQLLAALNALPSTFDAETVLAPSVKKLLSNTEILETVRFLKLSGQPQLLATIQQIQDESHRSSLLQSNELLIKAIAIYDALVLENSIAGSKIRKGSGGQASKPGLNLVKSMGNSAAALLHPSSASTNSSAVQNGGGGASPAHGHQRSASMHEVSATPQSTSPSKAKATGIATRGFRWSRSGNGDSNGHASSGNGNGSVLKSELEPPATKPRSHSNPEPPQLHNGALQ
ncbi:hypothetical protein CAOG_02779 [Capsaspora owczarzaki ATCC 30864]|nr:hypothetical protein CAOG_02779 [Capsaspora owczarzaki ATCC 30864]|eukprot:XP_004349532.1 hypothetical protein CAOG_02779 [Capsaspora owczarzaki ATCC 30864]